MARTQQTFENRQDGPIYVSVEPWPHCFELEPGDRLTLVWDAPETGDSVQVEFINARELVLWPDGLSAIFKSCSTVAPRRAEAGTSSTRCLEERCTNVR